MSCVTRDRPNRIDWDGVAISHPPYPVRTVITLPHNFVGSFEARRQQALPRKLIRHGDSGDVEEGS